MIYSRLFQLWKIETKIIDTWRIALGGKSWNIHDQSTNANLLDTLPNLWLRFNVIWFYERSIVSEHKKKRIRKWIWDPFDYLEFLEKENLVIFICIFFKISFLLFLSSTRS